MPNDPLSAFGVKDLHEAIQSYATIAYGRIGQLGIFGTARGMRSRNLTVETMANRLVLLPTQPVGGPANVNERDKRETRTFRAWHIPFEEAVIPEDVEGLREYGTNNEYAGLAQFLAQLLEQMAGKHGITLEHLMMGALKGIVLDADGATLVNLYTEFGVTQEVVDFELDVTTTDVRGKILTAKRKAEDGLFGDVYTGFRALCSEEFFSSLIKHADVKAAFDRWNAGEQLRNDPRAGFEYAGVIWEEYRQTAPQPDGNTRRFIAANEAHLIPIGTRQTFRLYFAPGDFDDAVNTLGEPMYVKTERRRFGRGTDVHTQQNPLPICLRPKALVKLTI